MPVVSRLRWRDDYDISGTAGSASDSDLIEVPHVRGVPVADLVPVGVDRIREWPNRLGVYEAGNPDDVVHWTPTIGLAPPSGSRLLSSAPGGPESAEPAVDLEERVKWFRRFLKSLGQLTGVSPAIDPPAACTILLTPGVDPDLLASASEAFPGAIGAIPTGLSEFPGGIQLGLSDTAWQRRDAYAGVVQDVVRGVG